MADPLLTASDVAALCQVSLKTVMRAIKSGDLRAARLGKRGALRICPADVDAWLDRSAVTPADRVADPRVAPLQVGRVFERGRLRTPKRTSKR